MPSFSKQTLNNIRSYLEKEKTALEKRLNALKREDPYSRVRITTNASPDADAQEETGHERALALRQEAARLLSKVKMALSKIGVGTYGKCDRCGKDIDPARLARMPMATLCLSCERKSEN